MTNQTVNSAFGLNSPRGNVAITKWMPKPDFEWASDYIANPNPNFVFEMDRVNDLFEFELSGYLDGCLFITGPRGAGKTSYVEQFFSRFGKPVFTCTGHERLEVADLKGSMILSEGKTQFSYGPLAKAAMCGGVLFINEFDACLPEVVVGLHDELEGKDRLIIPENGGEVVPIDPRFRVIVTGNTAGRGDGSGGYHGTNQLNEATLDRFSFLDWGYPEPEIEERVVSGAIPKLPISVVQQLVRAANLTRNGDVPDISTRGLIRWARKCFVFQSAGRQKPIALAFERAMGLSLSAEDRQAVFASLRIVFGGEFND
jgi:cobaltochelatase CobS